MALFKGIDVGKIRESVENGAKAVQDGIANIKPEELAQNMKERASSGASNVGKAVEGVISKHKRSNEPDNSGMKDFVALLWYLALVDGTISQEEREKIVELAREVDEDYESYIEEIETDCTKNVEAQLNDFGRDGAVKVEAMRVIETMELTPLEAKFLCWNLLAAANSDGITENEVAFVRFVAEKSGVDPALFEEMRSYCDALAEIESTRETLRSSNRTFAQIEPLIKELERREQVIVEAAQALVMDR